MANDNQFRYVPQQMFACSVPINGARQYHVVDGHLAKGDGFVREEDPAFFRSDRPERKLFKVYTRMNEVSAGLPFPESRVSGAVSVTLPARETMEGLLQIIAVRDNPGISGLQYGISIDAEEGSSGSVVLCSHTLRDERYSTTEFVDIDVKEGAVLNMLVLQNENSQAYRATYMNITLRKNATLNLSIITLHGGNIRNNIDATMTGTKGECNLHGLYLADGEQRIDTRINLFHAVPECVSSQLFKGILGGDSRSSFGGEIVVAPHSQKTEAYQANNNLLVSDGARASSEPHLKIYADDVKCSHGSTVGTAGEEEMFYMRSRGISEVEARLLQQQAFAGAVLEKISNRELRERLSDLVEKRLRGEFTKCSGCGRHCC